MDDLLGLGLDSTSSTATQPTTTSSQPTRPPTDVTTATPSTSPAEQATQVSTAKTNGAALSSASTADEPSPVASDTTSSPVAPPTSNEVFMLKQEEPSTPELKEIQAKFGGRWKLVPPDPYGEYLKIAGVGLLNRSLAAKSTPEQIFTVKGDKIYVSFHSTFHNQNYVYQLEQAVENLVEKSRQSVFASYKDGKLTLLLTSMEEGWNKTQGVERFINELGEQVMIHTCGSAVCRRYFARLPDVATLPPITQ
ncbi:Fatty acid-binding protein 9 [Bulinus truncatus]|nr:Fatty acid-binding protein 9 [Bulinus truncatus]